MPQARSHLVDPKRTPYYHCISRCVRQAYLCGIDRLSGMNFGHRRGWIAQRLKLLSSAFAIEVCSYAIMSNHYHLNLCVNTRQSRGWSTKEVITRWGKLYQKPDIINRFLNEEPLSSKEKSQVAGWVETRRSRLSDLSWFMRNLNEYIARRANKEEDRTGRFWEGRFISKALLDETALLTCMAYVDLNPIRAGISQTPEGSDFTSIQQRLLDYAREGPSLSSGSSAFATRPRSEPGLDIGSTWLRPFSSYGNLTGSGELPVDAASYFELVEWTGRAIRTDKAGAIPQHLGPLFERLHINEEYWMSNVRHLGKRYRLAIGSPGNLKNFARARRQKWVYGSSASMGLYRTTGPGAGLAQD